jgi:hypothetical protein
LTYWKFNQYSDTILPESPLMRARYPYHLENLMFRRAIMRRAPILGSSVISWRGRHELVALPYYAHGGTERIISQTMVNTLGTRDLAGIKSYITGSEYLELLYHIKKTAMHPVENDFTTSKISMAIEAEIAKFKGMDQNTLSNHFPVEFCCPASIITYAIDYGYNIPESVQNAILGENTPESKKVKRAEDLTVKIDFGFLSETYIKKYVINDHNPWEDKEISAITAMVDSMLEKRSGFPGSRLDRMEPIISPSDITGSPQVDLRTFLEKVREDIIKFKTTGAHKVVHSGTTPK